MLALGTLKGDIDGETLRAAIRMIDGAQSLYVIGQRRAFPVAAYLAYGLTRLEYPCHLLDSVGGMLPQQVATIGERDVLLAVSFAEYAPPVVEAVSDAHIRNIPVLAITDSLTQPARPQLQPVLRVARRRGTPVSAPWRARSCWPSR